MTQQEISDLCAASLANVLRIARDRVKTDAKFSRLGLDSAMVVYVMLEIEEKLGRERTERWGPRTIDLDLLLYDDSIINTPEISVPHPRMHERRFVLEPLAQIAPNIVHPTLQMTIAGLLESLLSRKG